MDVTAKITRAEVRQTELVPGIPGPDAVVADLDDGRTDVELFQFYRDELTFTGGEFVGLTEQQARDLHRQRDIAWLQS